MKLLAAVAGLLLLTACGTGPGMMNNRSTDGYPYSRPTCTAPAGLAGRVITVTLADPGMSQMMSGPAPMGSRMTLRASATTVSSGVVTFVAGNRGWRTHELVVLPLPAGSVAGQRVPGPDGKVDESGSLGEASASCAAGAGDGIAAGAVGWLTLDLAPGHYELICNLTNHYADAMYQELTVTGP